VAEEHPLGRVEGRRDICWPREVTNDDVGAERAQGVGAVVVVVRHRSYGPAALTQQCHDLTAHATDSPAGTGHQDETRPSHRPPPLVIHTSCPRSHAGNQPASSPDLYEFILSTVAVVR
jgi:O-acetyl-ADP-ribose deacetylase (regulator of RNase III)